MRDVTVIEADLSDAQHQTAVLYLVKAYARDPMGGGRDLPSTAWCGTGFCRKAYRKHNAKTPSGSVA
jgi:hypothetical protein